ncbi:MAG: NAD-dependent epimerase/dehydratase family protein [Methanobacteriaceae archaeon]|nr:NAD-dependent epimerase/dehydratase family protein [Methanobacteriaceae archaeon]
MSNAENTYKDSVVLVTGGSGCVGSNLVHKIAKYDPKKIIILDNLSSSYKWNTPQEDCIEFIQGDICDDQILKRVFKEEPDFIFHLAAHFANQNSVDNPEKDLKVNGLGILKVLEYAQLTNVERFVYSSSGCGVYGLDSKMPFKEDDISIKLHTPYQVTKLLGELYTNYFHNLYDMNIVNARFFNVFGPGEVPGKYRNVIPNFMYWAMNKQPLPITGDGTETRDWTYIEDILQGLTRMGYVKKAVGESINLGSGKDHQVIDMANTINDLCSNEAGIKFTQRRNWDAKTKLLSSVDKAEKILNYKPQHTFHEGLENTHQWFVDNWKQIQKSAEFE